MWSFGDRIFILVFVGTKLTPRKAKQVGTHQLWSAIVNINEPEIVVQAHRNFIAAGAQIIVTNSYKTNAPNLKKVLNYRFRV